MDILENINELGNKISNDLNLKNIQDKFLNSTLGQIANTAIDVGIKIMLPDYLENEVIEVKDALISEGLNEGINTAIENAIKIGKKMIGMENKEFVSIEQAIKAVGEGNVIKNISEGIDTVLNKVTDSNIIPSDITNIIKEGKNVILNNIDTNIESEFKNEIKALEKIEKYIRNWEKSYLKKDIESLNKEYNKIEKQMKKVLPLEKIINNVNKIRNINELINNTENFDFNNMYLDLAGKL